jgi:hypothetical protein
MKAIVVDGSVEEIAEFVKRMGGDTAVIAALPAAPAPETDIAAYVARQVRGNPEKERLVLSYLAGIGDSLRMQIPTRADGAENVYLSGRLTTLDENRVGNVVYCRPGSTRVMLRLPAHSADGVTYATVVSTTKTAEEFARVKHQVAVNLVNDEAVIEAINLTKLAVEMAVNSLW